MRIGVDYYPEHWDRSLWQADADLMAKNGVKLVRLAEFAWCRLEPQEGVFSFEWLDEAIALFTERGIGVMLCTPTSCPPLWLYEKHPDSVMVEKGGTPTRTGIRGHRCINHEAVRFYCERMIGEMTQHYAGNKAVVAWQIDNELEAYFCFCENCNAKFRQWLKAKYGTLEALNKAYGNVVWSGEYSSWEQIQPPYGHYPDAWLNPAFMLDYSRFASDNAIDFSNWQAELIRKNCPGLPVTTNVWFCGHMPDFYHPAGRCSPGNSTSGSCLNKIATASTRGTPCAGGVFLCREMGNTPWYRFKFGEIIRTCFQPVSILDFSYEVEHIEQCLRQCNSC